MPATTTQPKSSNPAVIETASVEALAPWKLPDMCAALLLVLFYRLGFKPKGAVLAVFLTTLYKLGFKQFSCKVANKWGGEFGQGRPRRYSAACEFQKVQTIYPICIHCQWAVLPGDSHTYCEDELRDNPIRRDCLVS